MEAGISVRTYRRWYKEGQIRHDKRADAIRPMPINKLTDAETAAIIDVCNQPRFASLPPTQIVPTLLDEGIYHGSESTFYRVLGQQGQLNRRGRSLAPRAIVHHSLLLPQAPAKCSVGTSPICQVLYVVSFITCI